MKTAWLYQMTKGDLTYSPEGFRRDIRQGTKTVWPIGHVRSINKRRPAKGDVVFFYFTNRNNNKEPGFYGWADMLDIEDSSGEITFKPKYPTNKLKHNPIYDEGIKKTVSKIRGKSPMGTMFEISDRATEELLIKKILRPQNRIDEGENIHLEKQWAAEHPQGHKQGFKISPEVRKAIEKYAIKRAEQHFCREGFDVNNVSQHKPYDLHCSFERKNLYVEVKGTRTLGEAIVLTHNEVEYARKHRKQMALFLLHSIKVSKKEGNIITSGGNPTILNPWNIDEGILNTLAFAYKLPKRIT